MIHDARRSGEHDHTEQTRGQEATNPVLEVVVGQVVTRAADEKSSVFTSVYRSMSVFVSKRVFSITIVASKTRAPTFKERMRRARVRSDPKTHAPDDAALVDTTVELDNDLTRSVVINELELVDVAYRAQKIYRQRLCSLSFLLPRRARSINPVPFSPRLSARRSHLPCFCITCKNLITTLETGRTST